MPGCAVRRRFFEDYKKNENKEVRPWVHTYVVITHACCSESHACAVLRPAHGRARPHYVTGRGARTKPHARRRWAWTRELARMQVQVDEIYGRDEAIKAIEDAMGMYKDQYLPKRAR